MRHSILVCIAGFFLGGQALAGNPQCYLHGVMKPKTGKKAEITDMLRLHFDAEDLAKCKRLITSYCRYNVSDQDYSPVNLEAFFKPDVDKKEKIIMKLSESCKIIMSDE